MTKNISILILISIVSLFAQSDEELFNHAKKIADEIIIVDTHIDYPLNLYYRPNKSDIFNSSGEFDYPRAMKGGLNVPFMSIYTPARLEGTGRSKIMADSLISLIENIVKENSDKFAIPHSVKDLRKYFSEGKISLAFGMENGSPIENDINNLKHFYKRGIRYITLAHGKSNYISDSSYDENKQWNGLSPFGEEVVKEMNRLGIMIDVSHLSDSAFYDVIRISKSPVIASHSSCRFFTPCFERNMSDEMIIKLANNGGVLQINFGSTFLRDDIRKQYDEIDKFINEYITSNNIKELDKHTKTFIDNYKKEHKPENALIKDVVAHIDHAVKLVGIDYVGIGSDFDGVDDTLPEGLKDVSYYPNLIFEFLKIGYSDGDVKKIFGENLLRVWKEVEDNSENNSE